MEVLKPTVRVARTVASYTSKPAMPTPPPVPSQPARLVPNPLFPPSLSDNYTFPFHSQIPPSRPSLPAEGSSTQDPSTDATNARYATTLKILSVHITQVLRPLSGPINRQRLAPYSSVIQYVARFVTAKQRWKVVPFWRGSHINKWLTCKSS
jgi:hypothetical protein